MSSSEQWPMSPSSQTNSWLNSIISWYRPNHDGLFILWQIRSIRKHSIIPAYWWTSLLVLLSSVVHPRKARRACQHWPSEPDSVSLIRIIKHSYIYRCRLHKQIVTFIFETWEYLSNLSFTLSLILLSKRSLNPLKRVDPPDSAIFL